jgi:hypothetical protein
MEWINNLARKVVSKLKKYFSEDINKHLVVNRMLLGKILSNANSSQKFTHINEAEFKIFSQWGDDGIIQYLISKIKIENKTFIEFGVEDYTESNTRFLLMNNNWTGLVIDGSEKNINFIKNDEIYWKYDLTAKCAFITAENINQLISEGGFEGNIGILHIDIDGNDYWVWKSLNVVSPDIVIMEYNSVLGIDKALTVPYKPDFYRNKEHHSLLYAGASLLAICDLAEEKGYYFIGSNSSGNNAYFVKKEKIGELKPVLPSEGYVDSKFREARNQNGELMFSKGDERLKILNGLTFYNTRTNNTEVL